MPDYSATLHAAELPAPPATSHIDHSRMPYMKLNIDDFMGSRLVRIGRSRHGLNFLALCCSAFRQTPAGSVPDDDFELAKLSAFQGSDEEFKAARNEITYGFIKHSDGRLYHPYVVRLSIDVWDINEKNREENAQRTSKARMTKLEKLAEKKKKSADLAEQVRMLTEKLAAAEAAAQRAQLPVHPPASQLAPQAIPMVQSVAQAATLPPAAMMPEFRMPAGPIPVPEMPAASFSAAQSTAAAPVTPYIPPIPQIVISRHQPPDDMEKMEEMRRYGLQPLIPIPSLPPEMLNGHGGNSPWALPDPVQVTVPEAAQEAACEPVAAPPPIMWQAEQEQQEQPVTALQEALEEVPTAPAEMPETRMTAEVFCDRPVTGPKIENENLNLKESKKEDSPLTPQGGRERDGSLELFREQEGEPSLPSRTGKATRKARCSKLAAPGATMPDGRLVHDLWEKWKKEYPQRLGGQGWEKARHFFCKNLENGVTVEELMTGARCYMSNCILENKTSAQGVKPIHRTTYVMMASSFLNPDYRLWQEAVEVSAQYKLIQDSGGKVTPIRGPQGFSQNRNFQRQPDTEHRVRRPTL